MTINDFSEVKRLLWVRGRQQVRADEVEMKWSSLNKADCFIFDMGNVNTSSIKLIFVQIRSLK